MSDAIAEEYEDDSISFMKWLDRAYRDGSKGDDPKFTKWNMEVAYRAGIEAEALRARTPPSDIAKLAADLTSHLADHGAWDVGSGGPDTAAQIARERAELHSGIQWLVDRAEPRLRGRHFKRVDP